MDKVFLAHPVTDWTTSNGEYRPRRKALIHGVIQELRNLDFEVMCAALNEDYGAIQLDPKDFTQYDVNSIEKSDLFVLLTTERLTRDMYLETGMALARGLPVIFALPASARVTYMIHGLEAMGDLKIAEYDSEENLAQTVREAIEDEESESFDSKPLSGR